MTISYTGNALQLLFRWKGSIWKSVWKELLLFLLLFYIVRFFHSHVLDVLDPTNELGYRNKFELLCEKFNGYTRLIPLTFLLGFYVSNVVSRWWSQFQYLCWPEDILSLLCFAVPGRDEQSAQTRHRIARYLNLTCALAWRDVSSKIRLRYPKMHSLVEVGLITEKELKLMEELNSVNPGARWLTPLHWIQQLLANQVEGTNVLPAYINNFNMELKNFRISFRKMFCADWVCVPLVYTQVAAIATYAYFFFCVFGHQHFSDDTNKADTVFPVFTVVQFLFFVGWFKVGQDLMRPFGMDDDDIELGYILDRNIVTSFTIVDRLQMSEPPPFEEDAFWSSRDTPNLDPSNKLQYERIDLSRNAHKHPPKLHTYVELKGKDDEDEKPTKLKKRATIIPLPFQRTERANKFIAW